MLRPQDIIIAKRDGAELSDDEIRFFVAGVGSGAFVDYQASALLMAIFLRGMTERERLTLTREMLASGETLDFSDIARPKVDKHSTGGVGDKTSLIIAPLAAACGLCVPMISGRGLGHTGGTLDKLEAIPGYRVHLPLDEFRRTLARVGFAMTGQTAEIAPVDKKLYALRDVTGTIESIPLIAASIMSKKLAEGLDGLVLDVKTGSGAFMKTEERARELAVALTGVGRAAGVRTVALVTDMNQPLGRAIGNRLEVIECFETLKGRGAEDLTALSVELTAQMLIAGGACEDADEARARVQRALADESGLNLFRESIRAQGGDPRVVDDYSIMPAAAHTEHFTATRTGFVTRLDAEAVGVASMMLGAGRIRTADTIDPAVGILLNKKIGDRVDEGEPLAEVHYNGDGGLTEARRLLAEAFRLDDAPPVRLPLIKAVV
jgi:pyrimidine-nucleoside phosphorylase